MLASTTLGALLLATTTLAAPVVERAGGPEAKPIPSSCSINPTYPAPSADAFSLTSSFQSSNQVYAYYLPEPDASDVQSFNESAKIQQCLEQCYGIGTGCTSVLWAHNVPHVSYGVQSSGVACLFQHVGISSDDLTPVTDGTYTNAQALDIVCPS